MVSYVVGEHTLLFQNDSVFHLHIITDNRLLDLHIAGYVDFVPYVSSIQSHIVSWEDKTAVSRMSNKLIFTPSHSIFNNANI